MAKVDVHITLDGKPLADPKLAAVFAKDQGFPTPWLEKANSITMREGAHPGEAHLLVLGKDLDLSPTGHVIKLQQIASSPGSIDNVTLTLQGWCLEDATACVPGRGTSSETLYYVRLMDNRVLAQLATTPQKYNLQHPNHLEYWNATLDAGNPWSWKGLFDDLIKSTAMTLAPRYDGFDELTDLPQNITGYGRTVAELWDNLLAIGILTSYIDPKTNEVVFAPIDHDLTPNGELQIRALRDRLMYSAYHILRDLHPATIKIHFPDTLYQHQADTFDPKEVYAGDLHRTRPWYVLDRSTGRGVQGTEFPIWDTFACVRDHLGAIENAGDLNTRADRLQGLYRALIDREHTSQVFSGLWPFTCGNLVSEVSWYNFGDGLCTQMRHELPERIVKGDPERILRVHRPHHRYFWGRATSTISPGQRNEIDVYYYDSGWKNSTKRQFIVNVGQIDIVSGDWCYAEWYWGLRDWVVYCPVRYA